MLVCKNCGKVIEDYELGTVRECHGYSSLGQAFVEEADELCTCGGEFVEAEKCKICGEWFDNEDLNGVCEVCIEKYETVSEALDMGAENTVSIDNINGAVASLLSTELINKILTKWVEENFIDHSKEIVRYCEEDEYYFAEWLTDKYGDKS